MYHPESILTALLRHAVHVSCISNSMSFLPCFCIEVSISNSTSLVGQISEAFSKLSYNQFYSLPLVSSYEAVVIKFLLLIVAHTSFRQLLENQLPRVLRLYLLRVLFQIGVTSPPHLHICDPAQHSGGSSGLRFCTLPPLVCPVSY